MHKKRTEAMGQGDRMHPGIGWTLSGRAIRSETGEKDAIFAWPQGFARIGLTLSLYGLATALLLYRAPAIFGNGWSWLALLAVPTLTLLVGGLRTGSALALVLVYAFASATAMGVQGFRLGWGEVAQIQGIVSHFATVFFLASAVALVSLLRTEHASLQRAEEVLRRNLSEDELSGLLTPTAFEAAAARELVRSRRTSRTFLILAVDVSDYFDPAAGSVTIPNAERIMGSILTAATRTDFDLWTMREPGLYLGLLAETDEQAVGCVLLRVLAALDKTSDLDGARLKRKARFGYSFYPAGGANPDALISAAITAMVPLARVRKTSGSRSRTKEDGRKERINVIAAKPRSLQPGGRR